MAPMTGPTLALHLRLDGVTDKDGFLDRCARDLRFPDWYGRNWDALADCLTDLSWWSEGREPSGCLLDIQGWLAFRDADPDAAAIAADILADAEAYWATQGRPLVVRYDDGP
ncbi:barstar family protein [Streptomyces sp. 4503]|uniref:Barstar family protein n=2 Tax=Streptomyces niphimycinicus TaxID=2842201 RepID=A0ABS6CR09_9ACTN|nr:barstar family protein [Streptomyces niphimycinicus]